MEGYATGEVCRRNECGGIIAEHDKDGCCSCHINPPCDYCTTPNTYCPVCGWDDAEEQRSAPAYKLSDEEAARYKAERDKQDEWLADFNKMWHGNKEAEKLIIRKESHTHFSMKVFGVHPEGYTLTEDDMQKIRGSFGGRFEQRGETRFIYIAYTD